MCVCSSGRFRLHYWLTLISGLLECLCFAGVMFGWASLVFVLKSDGYFSYLCINDTVNGSDITGKVQLFSPLYCG